MSHALPLFHTITLGITGVCALLVLNHMQGADAPCLPRVGYVLLSAGCFGEIGEWWWTGADLPGWGFSVVLHLGLALIAFAHVRSYLKGVIADVTIYNVKKENYYGPERRTEIEA